MLFEKQRNLIAFLDADDIWLSEKLVKQVQFLRIRILELLSVIHIILMKLELKTTLQEKNHQQVMYSKNY